MHERRQSSDYQLEQLVPSENIDRWLSAYGNQAEDWLGILPEEVATRANEWELTISQPLLGGSASVVVGAIQHEQPVVLKIHPPWIPRSMPEKTSAETEAAVFKEWGGECAPRLLASDKHALLLEHITDAHHSPDMSVQEMVGLVNQLAHPAGSRLRMLWRSGIPSMEQEMEKRFERAAAASLPEGISDDTLLTARNMASCFATYLGFYATGRGWELVHGDLKIKNILRRTDGSLTVIDPSPAIGCFLFDATLWTIDQPEGIVSRCREVADFLKIDPQVIGSLAVTLAIPEICLASPRRSAETLDYVQQLAGTTNLEAYFQNTFWLDSFMNTARDVEPHYKVLR